LVPEASAGPDPLATFRAQRDHATQRDEVLRRIVNELPTLAARAETRDRRPSPSLRTAKPGDWLRDPAIAEIRDFHFRRLLDPATVAAWRACVEPCLQAMYGQKPEQQQDFDSPYWCGNLDALYWRSSREFAYRLALIHRLPEIAGRLRSSIERHRADVAADLVTPLSGTRLSPCDLLDATASSLDTTVLHRLHTIIVTIFDTANGVLTDLGVLEQKPDPKRPELLPIGVPCGNDNDLFGWSAYETASFLIHLDPQHRHVVARVVTFLDAGGYERTLSDARFISSRNVRVQKALDSEEYRRTGRRTFARR
jgi:hypothetical protein